MEGMINCPTMLFGADFPEFSILDDFPYQLDVIPKSWFSHLEGGHRAILVSDWDYLVELAQ